MRKLFVTLPGLLLSLLLFGQNQPVQLSVIGSSTSACYGFPGGLTDGNCWVNRVVNYYNEHGYAVSLSNMAVSGYFVYRGMPDGSPPVTVNGGVYTVDQERNITRALSLEPKVVIVNYPSNLYDVANVHDVLSYFRSIRAAALAAGKTCFITTTQPRNFDANGRSKLRELKDSILLEYGFYALNFWDGMANEDGTINPQYGQGDGIHLNAVAHDTLARRVLAKAIFSAANINRTQASGSWNNPAIWEKGSVPSSTDSVILMPGYNITLDAPATIGSLYVTANATLSVNNTGARLQIGTATEANREFRVLGNLQLSQGEIVIHGRFHSAAGSSFTMTGGVLQIDGNNGNVSKSVADGKHLFEISPAVSGFSFTGGTLRVTDPPSGENSLAIQCPFNFGALSTLELGDGQSTTSGGHSNGFGGSGFPARIGRLVLDAVTHGNNRVFRVTQSLTLNSSVLLKSGHLIQAAPITVEN